MMGEFTALPRPSSWIWRSEYIVKGEWKGLGKERERRGKERKGEKWEKGEKE